MGQAESFQPPSGTHGPAVINGALLEVVAESAAFPVIPPMIPNTQLDANGVRRESVATSSRPPPWQRHQGGPDMGSSLWDAWIFVVDAAAHADEDSTAERIAALLMTVVGMLIFAILISLISDTLADQLDSLKQGKALVLESLLGFGLHWFFENNDFKLLASLTCLTLGVWVLS